MNYIGEHLLPGQIGHFFAIISLVGSLLATIAFYKSEKAANLLEQQSWLKIARYAFGTVSLCIIGMFVILYYIISNHLFEYKYAYTHSDKSLQVEYLLSCFWEGQEGSFMLWSFWNCMLGGLIIMKGGKWEKSVMSVVSFTQFALATMIIGIYFFNIKVGSSPFVLLRNEMEAPIFSRPEYLSFIKDGTGLNTLLQNYWMVIHPPILFLGFASTVIPFAFAVAGLIKNDHDWVKPALPWTSFSAAILGTGIMMGAAWAYESLSFGGYWAWDPVENASLVPWLILVAGLHTNLIYKNTGYSLRPTYFFYIISFSLVLYSTFLTRSGILGDTSVHAFTDLGMNTQLLLFVLVFFVPALVFFFIRYQSIPSIQKEEQTYSREFWMFIGSLILFLSGAIIILKTSTPVWNKLFGTNIAPPEDPEFAHNQIQIFIAILIGILTAITQYFKYKDTSKAHFKKIFIPTLVSLVVSLLISLLGNIDYTKKGPAFLIAIHLGIFGAVYAILANTAYLWLGLKGKIKAAGASIAHIGFGMVLLGILISSSKKSILSWNTTGISPLRVVEGNKPNPAGDPAENLTLFKGLATDMGRYMVTYVKDTINPLDRKRYYEIDFKAKNGDDSFKLFPDVIKNNKGMEGFAANPASKHYWQKDIFVYITSFQENKVADTVSFQNRTLKTKDTIFYSNGMLVLNGVIVNPADQRMRYASDETALFLDMTVISKEGKQYSAYPGIAIKGQKEMRQIADTVLSQSLIIQFNKVIDQKEGKLEIGIKETGNITDLLTLKVYEFPAINVLWLGILVMVIGFVMSIIQRINKPQKKLTKLSQ